MLLRDLTGDDTEALGAFECRLFAQPWADPVERMVRVLLPIELARGWSSAVGIWDGDRLCAVAAWRLEGEVCHSVVLAVALGYRRQGHAMRLKEEVISRARDAGARAVISNVYWDNEPMLALNRRYDASIIQASDDPDHAVCVIVL